MNRFRKFAGSVSIALTAFFFLYFLFLPPQKGAEARFFLQPTKLNCASNMKSVCTPTVIIPPGEFQGLSGYDCRCVPLTAHEEQVVKETGCRRLFSCQSRKETGGLVL